MTLREELIAAATPKVARVERVDLPAFWVREIDLDGWGLLKPGAGEGDTVLSLVLSGVCDSAGAPAFAEGDRAALRKLSGRALRVMAEAVSDFNGLSAKAGKDAEGNSAATLSGASSSASLVTSGATSEISGA